MSVLNFLRILLIATVASAATVRPVIIPGNDNGTCLAQMEREVAIQKVKTEINLIYTLQDTTFYECGPGLWFNIARLNMSDPSQRCPSAWREYNSSGVRACRRPDTTTGSCPGTVYVTGRQYNRVCGRVIGYQIGSPDAFGHAARSRTIDSYYVYGVSITHGIPRNHIWTYAAGTTEGGGVFSSGSNCPCVDPPARRVLPPSFVGNDYYCESGNARISYQSGHLYNVDRLWDGQQCEGECCSNGKSPPWFSVELPNPTTDDIEVRICSAEGAIHDDVPVQLLEMYIQ